MIKARLERLWSKLKKIKSDVRAVDKIKTAVILLLFLSAAALAARSGLFDLGVQEKTDTNSAATGQQAPNASGSAKVTAAGPYVIAVTDSAGSHCGLMYEPARLGQAYDGLSAYLGEAMGSAEEPVAVSETDWQKAISESGVYFDFACEHPLSLLASSLGMDMESSASEHCARRFCLVVEDGVVSLYYIRAKDNTFYKCATAISAAALSARLADYTPNGARFLYEAEYAYDLVDKYFIIPEGQAQIPGVTAQNPLSSGADAAALMELFGMNGYLAVPYTETDGTVYVDGSSTLRIGTDGRVTYKNSTELSLQGEVPVSLDEAISKTAQIAKNTIGAIGGEASTALSYVSYDQENHTYTLRYTYQINGLAVYMGEQSAMNVTMVDGIITSAQINFREYSYSGEDDSPLPAVQAMAVVQAKGGGTPLLCYVDSGGSVTADWTIVK